MRPIITHAITGMAVALLMTFFYKPYTTIESDDLVYAYNKGVNEALNAEKPSERLEAVCAALWFKGQHNGTQ